MNGSGATTAFTLALALDLTLALTPPLSRSRYDHGAQLFREGETAGSMFIIKSGRVEVSCRGADGRTNPNPNPSPNPPLPLPLTR